jgi:carbamoyl-phosphate synthase small subunit
MRLTLADGSTFAGDGFGANRAVRGEVVFNTATCGYVEALTDPSYCGQILVLTYPLIGNYGVPAPRAPGELTPPYESDRIQVSGLVVQNYVAGFSHHAATRSLGEWLIAEGVPAITGVDTRFLTRHLRSSGTMAGTLTDADGDACEEIDMRQAVFRRVAPSAVRQYGSGDRTVLLVDIGAKDNIVRSLLKRDVRVIRIPWHEDLLRWAGEADGVVIGNGPGDPADLEPLVAQVRALMRHGANPIFGICLGNQILARAAGASTYKLPYGHRGINQPVQDLITRKSFITSQNHGYAVDGSSLPNDWEPWFVNLNDGSNEGIRCKTRPFFSVQFHPEARPGPEDTAFLFDDFVRTLRYAAAEA